jgi:hypothetical protein
MTTTQPCSECGTLFSCGCGVGACWCYDYPAILPVDFARGCRCAQCLAKAIGRKIGERLAGLPVGEALELARQQPPTGRLLDHIDYTLEKGNYVYSRWYLLKRGTCCGNGCRNCPYRAGL